MELKVSRDDKSKNKPVIQEIDIREVLEILIAQLNQVLNGCPDLIEKILNFNFKVHQIKQRSILEHVYQALCYIIIRLLVIGIAEIKSLLPTASDLYLQHYSLLGLYDYLLNRLEYEGEEVLQQSSTGWPKIIKLFKVISEGLKTDEFTMKAYGGLLFNQGENLEFRAMNFVEIALAELDDYNLSMILKCLFGQWNFNFKKGQDSFKNLDESLSSIDSAYIGMVYEYMLNYQLRLDDSKDFLGKTQPALYLQYSDEIRKGSGSFYTRGELAYQTVCQTLKPLVTKKVGVLEVPRTPEEILALKICDPACGSGSFLMATLGFLAQSLEKSLLYYQRISYEGSKICVRMRQDTEEFLSIDAIGQGFQLARLCRYHIIQNCLYGVDLNPMAVELTKLSLWFEVGEERLPFSFLEERIKRGNSLIGCWSDYYLEYPVMAWVRTAGDKGHRGVHHCQSDWSRNLENFISNRIKPELIQQIKMGGKREKEAESDLVETFDCWSALWFWPADQLNEDTPTPEKYRILSQKAVDCIKDLKKKWGFFHWELEFVEVFTGENPGFDVIIGNPPWEVSKPKSQEFFIKYDPHYRTYSKQKALAIQQELFQDPEIEREWLAYLADYKALANYFSSVACPYGDTKMNGANRLNLMNRAGRWRDSHRLHNEWRELRVRSNPRVEEYHPYQYQGAVDLNNYKLFLEMSLFLLKKDGRLGMILPSSIYTDQGCTELRRLLFKENRLELLFGFENRKGIFPIDSRFKFCVIILVKGGVTEKIQTSFMHQEIREMAEIDKHCLTYSGEQIAKFSPVSLACLEIRNRRDCEILEKMYANSVLVGDGNSGWEIHYHREFDMTLDASRFFPLAWWEERGYKPDCYGRWFGPNGEVALPLFEGRMIGQFDPMAKGWIHGAGRSALWENLPIENKCIRPQYLFSQEVLSATEYEQINGLKLPLMMISSATNTRTVIGSMLKDYPCNNALNALKTSASPRAIYYLTAFFNSFSYDYLVRQRMGGMNLNFFILDETSIPPISVLEEVPLLPIFVARLNLIQEYFAAEWFALGQEYPLIREKPWKALWALNEPERLRLRCILDAIVAELYGLDYEDLAWILRNDPADLKGFWRIDEDKPLHCRQTHLTLVAFQHLKEVGLAEFGRGEWQLPEGVRNTFGNQLLPWQEELDVVTSWAECAEHVRAYMNFAKKMEINRWRKWS